jgi:uncharacterized membrane protein
MTKFQFRLTLSILTFISLLVLALYFWNFNYFNLSNEQSHWGAFGDYVGGILNPIFSFSAFILLLLNLSWQFEQNRINEQRHTSEDRDRRISIIAPILREIHSRLRNNLNKFTSQSAAPASANLRNNGSHKTYWEISDDFFLLYSFLLNLVSIDNTSPFLQFFKNQYLNDIQLLESKAYINSEIRDFFINL